MDLMTFDEDSFKRCPISTKLVMKDICPDLDLYDPYMNIQLVLQN